jgi:hypothetical protein
MKLRWSAKNRQGFKLLSLSRGGGGDEPLEGLALQNLAVPNSGVSGSEPDDGEPGTSRGSQVSKTAGKDMPKLEPPSSQLEVGSDAPLDALDLEDLDAPALDAEVGAQGGASAGSSAAEAITNENYLLLELILDNYVLAEDLAAYASGETTYLPMAAFLRNVGFPISLDPDFNSAAGWFIDRERTFVLDRRKGIVTIAGKEQVLGEFDVLDDGYALYVSNHALSRWFPVQLDVSPNDLTAKIIPTERLPIQKLLAQEDSTRGRGGHRISNEMRNMDYAFFEPSAMNITATGRYTKQKGKEGDFKDRVIAEYSGDLAYFSTNVYATGAIDGKEDQLNSLRFTAKRIDPESKMLGPLEASEVHLGDVRTVNFIGKGAGGGQQRGVFLTNQPLTKTVRYDSTTISGNSLPEWDVELYQDDRLIDSQKVGDDGEYEFDDVELFYGKNIFIIKKFGPHGEQEQEEEILNVTRSNIPVGDLRYQLSVTQQDSKTLDVSNNPRSKDQDNIAGAIKTDIGLTPTSYLTLGLESETIRNIRHNYAHIGATHSFTDRANLHIEGQADTNGGQLAQGVLQMGFSPFSLSLAHEEHFDEFDFPVIRKSTASISPKIKLPWDDVSLSTSFIGSLTQNQNSTSKDLGNQLTLKFFKNIYVSNQMSASSGEISNDIFNSMSGRTSLRATYPNANNTLWGEIEVRGSADYSVKPVRSITGYEFNIFDKWRLTDNVSAFLQYGHTRLDKNSDSSNTYGGGFFIKMGELSITPAISYSDTGVINVETQFSLPLAINPRNLAPQYEERSPISSGGVSALVFLDKNYNYIYDGDDEPLENVTISALQVGRKELTDSSGMALIHGLPANLPVDIDIEGGKDWGSLWSPRYGGEAIYPRPGKTYLIDVPVQITSAFDGLVMGVEGGSTQPYPSVPLELVKSDGEVVAETTSEHDGFYLFEGIIPGKYRIRPKHDFLQARGVFALPTDLVEVTSAGKYVSYLNVYMSSNKRDLILSQASKFSEFSDELSVVRRFSSYEEAKEAGGMLSSVESIGSKATILSEAQPSMELVPQVFVHVESYKDLKLAENAISFLYENHSILSSYEIMALRNDVAGKGVYYRVVVATPSAKDAIKLSAYFKKIGKYANVVKI